MRTAELAVLQFMLLRSVLCNDTQTAFFNAKIWLEILLISFACLNEIRRDLTKNFHKIKKMSAKFQPALKFGKSGAKAYVMKTLDVTETFSQRLRKIGTTPLGYF